MLISAAELATLPEYLLERIVNALRRDMREEEQKAYSDKEWAAFHRMQARQDKDLLELLNPKQINRERVFLEPAGNMPPRPLQPGHLHQVAEVLDLPYEGPKVA